MSIDGSANKPNEYGPFNAPLEQTGQGRRETFHQLESRPDLFIRRRNAEHYDTERMNETSRRFEDLRSHGVNVPPFRAVIGEDAQGKAEFLVADKVQGERLDALVDSEAELPSDIVNKTFKGIGDYLKDSQENNTPVFWDFALRQFMLGHTASNLDDDIYLTDIDSTFSKLDGEVLGRVVTMMQAVHERVPLEEGVWQTMRQLIIANDAGRITEEEQRSLSAWLKENLPPNQPDGSNIED